MEKLINLVKNIKCKTLINLDSNNYLITMDLRLKEVRIIRKTDKSIIFHKLSNDDISGYTYLFKNDLRLFFNCLKEDLRTFYNIKLNNKEIKILNGLY